MSLSQLHKYKFPLFCLYFFKATNKKKLMQNKRGKAKKKKMNVKKLCC